MNHHEHLHDHVEAHGTGHRQRGRGRGRGTDFGEPSWGGGRSRGADFGGPPWGGGRRRMRRGGIRQAILLSLETEPAHGYEIMRRLEERSGGMWRPSPGSVYPTLQMLEDEGAVRAEPIDGTRVFALTDKGREELAASASKSRDDVPWERRDEGDDNFRSLRQGFGQIALAARQLSSAGTPDQIERGIQVIQRARKELYQILSED